MAEYHQRNGERLAFEGLATAEVGFLSRNSTVSKKKHDSNHKKKGSGYDEHQEPPL